ncbi:MAG: GNAT family N-acetyltransferase [Candidatus Paceibacterota bacterium]
MEDKDIVVWVASYNQKAISFYKKLGFVKTDKDMSSQFHKLPSGKFIPEIDMILRR